MSKNIVVFRDSKHSYEYKKTDNIITCKVTTRYKINDEITTLKTRAKAKCSPQDKFNYRFGCELAKARAKQKLSKKIEKLLINYSNKNSEKKVGFIFSKKELEYLEVLHKSILDFYKNHPEYIEIFNKWRVK